MPCCNEHCTEHNACNPNSEEVCCTADECFDSSSSLETHKAVDLHGKGMFGHDKATVIVPCHPFVLFLVSNENVANVTLCEEHVKVAESSEKLEAIVWLVESSLISGAVHVGVG